MRKKRWAVRWACFLVLLLLIVIPASAEPEPEFATLAALENAIIPPRDRVALAIRLQGVREALSPPTAAAVRQVGERQTFWVTNTSANLSMQVEASLRVVGEHIYVWVDEKAAATDIWQPLADAFDASIYDAVRALWGSENTPGVDGDPRIYALFAHGLGSSVAAYYSSEHAYPQFAVPTSNQHEMVTFNLDTLGGALDVEYLSSVLAHEFQHMIRHHQDANESTWLDEGFSTFTELHLGHYIDAIGPVASFLSRPRTQLNTWAEDGPRIPHYGASLMFVTYFYEQFGLEALRDLSQEPVDGLASVDAVLRRRGQPGVNTFFADWVLANFLLDPALENGRYRYDLLRGLTSPPPQAVVNAYPYLYATELPQYTADYFVFNDLRGRRALDVSIAAPDTVSLVDTEARSGRTMWYSNRADESDTTLTRAFDLTGAAHATLNFRVWYHFENLWDYGYVMVSTDGGAGWSILSTPHTTEANPHFNAYGPGYTGSSGGWIDESISLDAYAGQTILLRFEAITDDAVTQPGMLIDDVSIPEVGYSDDFEAGDGGWQAEGWILMDNTLPQQVWVQAVQQAGTVSEISRWLAPDDQTWSLPLRADVDQVVLVVSPFAPLTTVPMPYVLSVGAR